MVYAFIAATFGLAGFVKGLLGMGLPTVAMALLALAMPPAQAAALLAAPSLATNLWQLFAAPGRGASLRRLWPMMAGVLVGTLASAGILTSDHTGGRSGLATTGLGVVLALYGALGLAGVALPKPTPRAEAWLGPGVGLATGLVTGATGVFVLPAVPWLQAIGLEKDELVQGLGLSFTVSTIALALALWRADAFPAGDAALSLLLLAPAFAGMFFGQRLRGRWDARTFRRGFFAGLLALGLYLAAGVLR